MTEKPDENDDDYYDGDCDDDFRDDGVIDVTPNADLAGLDPVKQVEHLTRRLEIVQSHSKFWKADADRHANWKMAAFLYMLAGSVVAAIAIVFAFYDIVRHQSELDEATRSAEEQVEAAEQRELEAFRACAAAGRSTTTSPN